MSKDQPYECVDRFESGKASVLLSISNKCFQSSLEFTVIAFSMGSLRICLYICRNNLFKNPNIGEELDRQHKLIIYDGILRYVLLSVGNISYLCELKINIAFHIMESALVSL